MKTRRPARGMWAFAAALSILSTLILGLGLCSGGVAAQPPAPRWKGEVEAVLARSPGLPSPERMRELRIVLVANEKDHGPEEHDYPLWWKRWAALLGGKGASEAAQVNLYGASADAGAGSMAGVPRVKVSMAWGWPRKEDLDSCDLIVAFIGTGGRWNLERIADLKRFLERGGGFVAIHSAVITSRDFSRPLAELLGLAWEDGFTTFRHGPVDLRIAAPDHPICLGLPATIRFEDETYWPLVGEREKIDLLATADERVTAQDGSGAMQNRDGKAPQPMFWTRQQGKGRVFASILGHYNWTFDDPYFRLLLLRGMAWAARESTYRFDPLVLRGARVREGTGPAAGGTVQVGQGDQGAGPDGKSMGQSGQGEGPAAKEQTVEATAHPVGTRKPRAGAPPAAPPDPKDPRLLLWLNAGDGETLTVDADGGVSDWSGKGGRRGLSSWGTQRPLYAATGPAGRPTVRFDGKDDILRDTGFRRSAASWTVFVVSTLRSNEGGFRALLAGNRTGVNDYLSGVNLDLGAVGSGLFDTLNLEGSQHAGQCNLKAGPAPFGTYIIVVTCGKGEARAFVNGVREGSRASSAVSVSLDEIRIGGRIYQNPAGTLPLVEQGFLDGDISEVVLYGDEITEEEREKTEAYLEEKYGAALVEVHEPTLDDAFEALATCKFAKGRMALGPIDAAIAASHGDAGARGNLEERLLAALRGPATRDARDFVCRRLGMIGTSRSVPAMAPLLEDEELSNLARCALERISGPEAAAALRAALAQVTGKVKAGVVDSLGRIGDQASLPNLTALLGDRNPTIAAAAAAALGRLGSVEPLLSALEARSGPMAAGNAQGGAPEANQETRVGEDAEVAEAVAQALLDQAWKALEAGRRDEAARIFERVCASAPEAERIAALRGLARVSPAEARGILEEWSKSGEQRLRAAAGRISREGKVGEGGGE